MLQRSRSLRPIRELSEESLALVPSFASDWCPGDGEQPLPYRVVLEFSAPGYSEDQTKALVYLHYRDCVSEGHYVWSLKRQHGQWAFERGYILRERGE